MKNSQDAIAGGKQEFHGKLPHEKDFEEWKDEVPDKPASNYKSQEEQFKDLHDRLTALVCSPPPPHTHTPIELSGCEKKC